MTLWLLIAIGAGLASNVSNFIARQILKDEKDILASSFYLEAAKVAIFTIALLFDHNFNPTPKSLLLLTLIVISEPFAIYLYMKMHELNHLSISSIITRTRMIWAAILALVFLGEVLNPINYAGIAILFLGLSIVVAPHRIFVDRGVTIATLFSLEVAVFSVLVKAASPDVSLPIIFVCSALPAALFFLVLLKNKRIALKAFTKTKRKQKIIFGISNFSAFYGFVLAITLGSVAVSTAIYQGMIIFGVLAGIILLNERENIARKIIGSAVTVIGIILLAGIS